MTAKSGARGRTRDIGLNHQAGKGSANRSNSKEFRERFDAIQFPEDTTIGFEKRGTKLVKTYGVRDAARTSTESEHQVDPCPLGVVDCPCTK